MHCATAQASWDHGGLDDRFDWTGECDFLRPIYRVEMPRQPYVLRNIRSSSADFSNYILTIRHKASQHFLARSHIHSRLFGRSISA